jgi:hypothetical protein
MKPYGHKGHFQGCLCCYSEIPRKSRHSGSRQKNRRAARRLIKKRARREAKKQIEGMA